MSTNIVSVIIVLGILVLFHELGHFLVARFFGVGVEKFSIGFGPRIIGKQIGITDYRLSAIPLGGFVKMVGDEPDSEVDSDDIHLSFSHKHVFKRILIVAAGPLFNLLLAVVIFYGFFQIYGTYTVLPVVGKIKADSPAMKAGLKEGDRIVFINSIPVGTWEEMAELIGTNGASVISLRVLRKNSNTTIEVLPESISSKNVFGEDVSRYIIGITPSNDHVETIKLNPVQAFYRSIVKTCEISKLMVVGIVKLVKGEISKDNLGGPIMIAQMAGDQAREGVSNLINFIAFISINLAILNFLPIPVLDGGHLLFFSIELIGRRPVSLKVREIAQQCGVVALLLLMVFVIYNDIMQVFIKK